MTGPDGSSTPLDVAEWYLVAREISRRQGNLWPPNPKRGSASGYAVSWGCQIDTGRGTCWIFRRQTMIARPLVPLQVLALLLVAGLAGTVFADTKFYNGRTEYILVTTARTWDAAEADAVAKGGHLAQINDATESTLILSKIMGKVTTTAPDGGGAKYVWIGGKEAATEGTYAWIGGNTFWAGGSGGSAQNGLYQNWGRLVGGLEPDNYGSNQNRAALALERWPISATTGQEIGQAGQWNDVNHTNALYYVIERSITKPAEGLFAVFQMTHGGVPKGSFTCQLHYDKAPLAVANFITLVEGTRGWIDASRGWVSNAPLYNGLKFHRVMSNFMIQGGDPNGDGTGGPGYRFIDEFSPDLRHDHPGVLSMANSGVNTNGSQFFVTVKETAWLDDVHTIFGEVVEGYESVVLPLSNVPVNGTTPVQDVVITSVTIQRLGAAALAFSPLNPALGLPACSMHQTRLERSASGALTLRWTEPAHCTYALADSPDLANWSGQVLGYPAPYYSGYNPVPNQSRNVTNVPAPGELRHFFHLAKVVYTPLPTQTPQGRKFVLNGKINGIVITITVTSATDGSHLIQQPSSGFVLSSTLSNVVWNAPQFDLANITSDINPPLILGSSLTHSDWNFTYRTATSGTFTGGFYTANRSQVLEEYGDFTVAPLP